FEAGIAAERVPLGQEFQLSVGKQSRTERPPRLCHVLQASSFSPIQAPENSIKWGPLTECVARGRSSIARSPFPIWTTPCRTPCAIEGPLSLPCPCELR